MVNVERVDSPAQDGHGGCDSPSSMPKAWLPDRFRPNSRGVAMAFLCQISRRPL